MKVHNNKPGPVLAPFRLKNSPTKS